MAVIRPVITDFSAGELSPKLAGRFDSPVYSRGAQEMTNFIPGRLGGAYRRGGLRYIADAPSASAKTRLIPWSVNDDLDILIVMTGGAIRLFNASAGTTAEYIVADGLPITILGGTTAAYAEADIFDVKYAQNINEIIFVHKDYPAFRIKIADYDTDTLALSLEYGLLGFEGNIAYSPELTPEELASTDPFPSDTLVSYLNALAPDVSYAASGILGGKTVASVIKNKSTVARHAVIGTTNWLGQKVDSTVYNGADKIPVPGAYGTGDVDVYVRYASGSGLIKKWNNTAPTKTEFLDVLAASMLDKESYYMEYDDDDTFSLNPKSKGTVTFLAGGTSYTYTITFTDASSLVIDPDVSVTLNGYFEMAYPEIEVNKNTVTGTKLVDRIAAWMIPEVAYACDSATQFCGGYPVAATRYKGGKIYDQAGDLLSEDDPYISVDMMDGTAIVVKRGDTGLSGQLGVIVTPFYQPGDNPSVVAYHQGRAVLGGSRREPNTLYLSKVGDTSNFCYFDEIEFEATAVTGYDAEGDPIYTTQRDITQQVGASSAIRIQLATEENEEIRSLTSVSDLLIQTATSEWIVPYGVTALNPQVVLRGRLGASNIQGRFVGDSVFSVSRTGRQIRAFSPREGSGQNVTEHAEHIAASGVTSLDFRQDPEPEIIAVLGNGTLLVGKVAPDIVAWSRVQTRAGDLIESAVCLSAYDEDAIYCVVKRTVGGVVARYIERLVTPDEDTFSGRSYLDCSRYGTTAAGTGIISGLTRYDGAEETWIVLADGTEGALQVISGGTATEYLQAGETVNTALPVSTAYILGFRPVARIQTFRLDSSDTEGYDKAGGFAYLRLYKSGDLHIIREDQDGLADADSVIDIPNTALGVRKYPFSGSMKIDFLSPSGTDASVIIEAQGAESAGIQVIAPSLTVSAIEEPTNVS